MIIIVQRVSSANVKISGKLFSNINQGLLLLVGIEQDDEIHDLEYCARKILNLRIFEDNNNKMNLSIIDINGEILVISQFTLCANLSKGRRPNFFLSASPEKAEKYYLNFIKLLNNNGIKISTGSFGSMMDVNLINNGPATFIINSKEK